MGWTRDELRKRSDAQVAEISSRVRNRFANWQSVFARWQLGTRPDTDPESEAVRDHRELTMLLRAEVNALTALLVNAGFLRSREFVEQLIVECEHLDSEYEKRFPGFHSTDDGMYLDLPAAGETMKGWKP
jgi:hypothetical protein